MNKHVWDDDYSGNYEDYSINEDQRRVLLTLIKLDIYNSQNVDPDELKIHRELEELFKK